MTSRRKFLLQGSMAGTAFFAANPLKTFSASIAPVTGVSVNDGKVVFIHTGDHKTSDQYQTLKRISNVVKNTGAVVLLHAGDKIQTNTAHHYDATMETGKSLSFPENNYKIFYKSNIKIAVITAHEGGTGCIKKISELSAYLKTEKKCQMVVCLSQLGYKNKNMIDDITLAGNSNGLDIIVSGHPSNYSPHTIIVLNNDQQEVIIQPSSASGFDFGNVEVGFDQSGNKRYLAFNNLNTSQVSA